MIGFRPPGYANGGMADDGTMAPGYANGGSLGFRPLGYANGGMPHGYNEGGEAVPSDVLGVMQELKRITDTGSTQELQAFVQSPGVGEDLRAIILNFPQFAPVIEPLLAMFPPAPERMPPPALLSTPEDTGMGAAVGGAMSSPLPPMSSPLPPMPTPPPPQMMPPEQMPLGPTVQGMNRGGIMSLRHM